ncbi:MFS transporter [Knoellia remsis]|uniref:MFS transporter n=1 Tax=Knoellia remsis TaxID=407159 RepID=A0A2T0ULG7_9MICO|nr:MFS transporter [Knoellia remsis]PRY58782.1 MFS transporter [Knoellia remsis]
MSGSDDAPWPGDGADWRDPTAPHDERSVGSRPAEIDPTRSVDDGQPAGGRPTEPGAGRTNEARDERAAGGRHTDSESAPPTEGSDERVAGGRPTDPHRDGALPRGRRGAPDPYGVKAGTARAVRFVGRGTARGARLAGRGAGAGATKARAYAESAGAKESGLARLVELHFVTLAGDAALTVSLAGTIFAIPTDEARAEVAKFLLLTMAPFALLAPFIGPLLDRFRHGRRWAIGGTVALRAFLCWVLAGAVATGSAWLFPAALGCLVAAKAYGVTRSATTPRLLPEGFTLVSANSRIALAGVAGMGIGGGLAGALARVGPDWSLRLAFVIYVVATVLAIRLPARVDYSAGEADPEEVRPPPTPAGSDVLAGVERQGVVGRLVRRLRGRVLALPASVRAGLVTAMGARVLTGFLTFFMAFLMREHPIPGWSGTLVLALVVGAAGAGNALGTLVGNAASGLRPDRILATALIVIVTVAVVTAVLYSLPTLLLLGLSAGLCAQVIKLSLDAVIQRDVDELVRSQTFAWSETLLQIAWVIGGGLGIALPLNPRLGFGVIAGVLVGVLFVSIRVRRAAGPAPAARHLA